MSVFTAVEHDGVVSVHVAPGELRCYHFIEQLEISVIFKELSIFVRCLQNGCRHLLVLLHDISHFFELVKNSFLLFGWFGRQVVNEDLHDSGNLSQLLNSSNCILICESEDYVFHGFKHGTDSFWCISVGLLDLSSFSQLEIVGVNYILDIDLVKINLGWCLWLLLNCDSIG